MNSPAFLSLPPGGVRATRCGRDPRQAVRLPRRRPVVTAVVGLPPSPGPPPSIPPPPPPQRPQPQPPALSRRHWLAASTAAAAATAAGLLLPPGAAVAAETAGAVGGATGGAPLARSRRDELIFDTHSGSFLPPHPQQLLSRRVVVDGGWGAGGGGASLGAAREGLGAADGVATTTRVGSGAGAASTLSHLPAQVDRLVVVGETHTHRTHHRIQLDIIRALHDLSKAAASSGGGRRPVVVGLEQFHRQHTPHLDLYITGIISLPRLLKLTDWPNTWGYPAALYTPLLSYCRAHRVRVVGLNAPGKLVAAVARGGLDSLPASVVPYLPEMDLGNRAHFTRFAAKMAAMGGAAHHTGGGDGGGGGGGSPRFDPTVLRHYYEAETLWDEYMAESAAAVLDADPACRLVVLAGTAHVENRDGLPERVERRTGGRAFTVLPTSVRWTVAAGTSVPDIAAPLGGGGGVADWIWYSPREVDLV